MTLPLERHLQPMSTAAIRAQRAKIWSVNWRRTWSGLALLLLGCGLSASAVAQQSYDVAMRDGLLTIRANATPAEQIAQALGDATGIAIVITGEASTPLSAEIIDEPIAKAIALLAPNHLLVRASADVDADITEVVLMMPDAADGGGGDSAEFLPSGAPADDVAIEQSDSDYDSDGLPIDQDALRDPNRVDAVRAAAESELIDPLTGEMSVQDANGGNVGGFQEPEIDPATGEPVLTQ